MPSDREVIEHILKETQEISNYLAEKEDNSLNRNIKNIERNINLLIKSTNLALKDWILSTPENWRSALEFCLNSAPNFKTASLITIKKLIDLLPYKDNQKLITFFLEKLKLKESTKIHTEVEPEPPCKKCIFNNLIIFEKYCNHCKNIRYNHFNPIDQFPWFKDNLDLKAEPIIPKSCQGCGSLSKCIDDKWNIECLLISHSSVEEGSRKENNTKGLNIKIIDLENKLKNTIIKIKEIETDIKNMREEKK